MTTHSSSLNRKVTLFGILCLLLLFVVLIFHHFSSNLNDLSKFSKIRVIQGLESSKTMSNKVTLDTFWDESFNLTTNIPENIVSDTDNVVDHVVMINNVEVFYRESVPSVKKSDITLLLLHGMRFSSKTWLDLKTIQIISSAGYRVIALDLPGFAKSPKPDDEIEDKAGFLINVIKSLSITKPVIVSPSFSGHYSLPLIRSNWSVLAGYIPVAPVGQDVLLKPMSTPCQEEEKAKERFNRLPEYFKKQIKEPIPDFSCIKVPTMVVYGEHDRSHSSALLSLLPVAKTFEVPNGDHPAYLKDPLLWHKIVYNFLNRLHQLNN